MSGLEVGGPGQMTFDLDLLMQQEVATRPWQGAPLTYTADYYTPAELEEAFERYIAEHGHFGSVARSHMWRAGAAFRRFQTDAHSMHLLTADGWCEIAEHTHGHGALPGMGVYQSNCVNCRWHSIQVSENAAVEAWHDHALPGWRDLPVVPHKLTGPGWDLERTTRAAVTEWSTSTTPRRSSALAARS